MASLLSGPIAPHPMYSRTSFNDSMIAPAPRVKPEAATYASHGRNGTIAHLFEVTGTSFGTTSAYRTKKQPKDHVSENVRRMRQIQRRCREKQRQEEAQAPTPVKALWKSEKYEAIPSKLSDYLSAEPPPPRPSSANFLRAHSRTGLPPRPQSSRSPRINTKPPPEVEPLQGFPVRSASCSDLSAVGKQVNFVKLNGMAASRQQIRRPPSATSLEDTLQKKAEKYEEYKRNVKGATPKYLEKRKEEWKQEEEERIRNLPDPDQPPGHKRMPDEERLETLQLLQQSHKDLHAKLGMLPIRSDTLRLKKMKEELDSKIGEVEEAIKIFSRPKVFVKIE